MTEQQTRIPPGRHSTITPGILYFGTPVVLLTTVDGSGRVNLAPISSAWALGQIVVLGVSSAAQTGRNLRDGGELVINVPGPEQRRAVGRLAPTTGRTPVPKAKRARFRYAADKFAVAGLTPEPAVTVRPPRVAECPLQFEARTRNVWEVGGFHTVQAEVLRVHAHPGLVVPGTDQVGPAAWRPPICNFRHCFGLGAELGRSFRAEC